MKKFCDGSRSFYEQLMQQPPNLRCSDALACQNCKYYRPEWKYRFCKFTECPYVAGFKTFKEMYEN